MLTLCAISSKRQGLRTSNLVYRWRTTTCISHMRHDLQGQGHTRPINGVTHRPPNLLNGKVYELQTWYTDGGRWLPSATGAMTSKVKLWVKVARLRDQSEPSWPNAVPVSLEAGGAYRVGRTRRPHFLFTHVGLWVCQSVGLSVTHNNCPIYFT